MPYDVGDRGFAETTVANGRGYPSRSLRHQGRTSPARIRRDPEGLGRSHDEMAAAFEAVTMTSAEKAAEIICRRVERGKARILAGTR